MRPGMQRRTSTTKRRPDGPAETPARILATAVDYHRRGLLDEAAALYRRVLKSSPEQPDALHLLGRIEEARGNPARALALIDRAIAASGEIAAYHTSRGSALLSLGRAEDAASSLRQRFRSILTAPRP